MSPLRDTVTAFIGCGAMGEAMLAGMLTQGLVTPEQVVASHPRPARRDELATRYGVRVEASNLAAAAAASVLALTVKPQVMPVVLRELRGELRSDQVVLSISAGTSIETLATGLLHPAIVRAMPNAPAQIGAGLTVWMATPEVTERQRAQISLVLAALGAEVRVDDERQIAMATALSGSGPAYVFLVMEAMIDAGVHLGFSRRLAEELVVQTMLGSARFAQETGKHPAELRNMVTSPGGTTAAALYEMEKGGLRTVFSKAIYAAYRRSLDLSGGDRQRNA
ncbi:MAG: pyrroline-5-carboxylate reductase [Chloroflexi bacterium]|nr:pyrroline-5-carboxylate reductase [Chloroflexota bacterium]